MGLKKTDFPFPNLNLIQTGSKDLPPWFGETARDTLVSLPAVVGARMAQGEAHESLRDWTYGILRRWEQRLQSSEAADSKAADVTLWYCHALAALWVLGMETELFHDFEERFGKGLELILRWIEQSPDRLFRKQEDGLLEILEPHSTWLQEQTGATPELNALWFQARLLHFLWGGQENIAELELMGKRLLERVPEGAAADVYVRGLPLAPSFILQDWQTLRSNLKHLHRRIAPDLAVKGCSGHTPPRRRTRSSGGRRTRGLARLWLKDLARAG